MFNRLKRALLTWPSLRDWLECGVIAVAALTLIALGAGLGGLIWWQPRWEGWPLRLLGVLCVPAFTEELVFRGMLVPDRGETRRPILWIGLAVLVFTGWHVVEGLWLFPNGRLFLNPLFLLCAAILGLGCAMMRYHTRSLWPAVILHGLLVWTWQVLLGGPDVAQLLQA